LAKSTRDLYANALKHVDQFWPMDTDEAWLSQNIDQFAQYLESKGLSGKSIQQYLTCTKIFLKWAGHPTEFTYRISNKLRQENKRKHLDRWFSEDDIERCLDYRFDNGEALAYRIIVRLLVETGARVGEIANITADDIHLDDRYVFIQGKTEPRPVIFSDETAALLKQYLCGTLPWGKAMKIFPEVSKIKAAITRMLEDLGLKNGSDGRGPHTFRHYACTWLFYVGNMRIEDLAFLLGDKVETIRERYLHPTPAMIRDRVQAAWKKTNR
jgi:integrase